MSDYPRMLYLKGGDEEIFGLNCKTMIVEDADDEQYHVKAEGWARTPFEAHGVEPPKPDPITQAAPASGDTQLLLDEIDQLRADLSATRDKLAETEALLAEATKPAEKPRGKETLGVKAS